MASIVRRVVALTRTTANATTSSVRALATQASTPSSLLPSKADPRSKYLVQDKPERPAVARISPSSSRIAGRTPSKPRKSISPLKASADGIVPTQSTQGQVKIFLPSVFVRLVRNTGQHASDPYTATFRTDLRLTKPDISNYLLNIYGLAIDSIRTINYSSPLKRNPIGGGYSRGGGTKSYKKVLVTMKEPFWYPEERSRDWCNEHFQREAMEEMRDRKMLKIGDGQKYGVASERYRGAHKSSAEVARLTAIAQAGGTEIVEEGDGKSALRRPSGRKMRKNVVRSRAERIGEKKSVIESEMDRLREAGW
ncbi:large subunit ribosomal protein L23, partial [Phenoliferia sp. Uapishka_3]